MGGCVAIVVGAGRGQRFGGDMPKQYLQLAGVPVLRHTLKSFLSHPLVDAVCPVINFADKGLFSAAAAGLKVLPAVAGGASRQQSVLLGLKSIAAMEPEHVLIHDGARPIIGEELISNVLLALKTSIGAIPALAISDTLKRSDANNIIIQTMDRSSLWRAQTPQGFRFAEILAAHRRFADAELTDDAAIAEKAGISVVLVKGCEDNMKITTKEDLVRAQRMMVGGEARCGFGFDAHRLVDGDHVVLCGITIPFDGALDGHSDADVGLHALTDALLGAVSAGDIGEHFPPDDAQWRGAASDLFLKKAGETVTKHGGVIANIDVTIICEKPKIGPHRAAMISRIAEILELPEERVSVKATTTEGMGFSGRGEGIAAQAIATVTM